MEGEKSGTTCTKVEAAAKIRKWDQLGSVTNGTMKMKGIRVSGLMKALIGKLTLSGGWEANLNICIRIYKRLSQMRELTTEEKYQAVPVLMSGDTLGYFSTKGNHLRTYDDGTSILRG